MIEFSAGQRKTIASGLTVLALTVVFAFVGAIAWALLKLLSMTANAIIPVAFGFFLSLFFKPYYQWMLKRVKNPTLAVIVMLLSIAVPLGLLMWHAGAMLVDQVSSMVEQGPALVSQVTHWFTATFPRLTALLARFGIELDHVGELYTKFAPGAIKAGVGALKCIPIVVSVLFSLLFFVFFLTTRERRGGEVVAGMAFLKPETREFLALQIDTFIDILVSFFQRQTVICLLEGMFYGIGFAIVGLPYGFVLGFLLGTINLVPLLGSLVCMPVAIPLAHFSQGGSITRVVLVICVWLAGQLLDGYLLTPKIQGNKTGLGYAGVIFSFFFWSSLLGPMLGMLLAIPLSAFCVVLWRALTVKYVRPLV